MLVHRTQAHEGEIHKLSGRGSADTARGGDQGGTRGEQVGVNHVEMLEKDLLTSQALIHLFCIARSTRWALAEVGSIPALWLECSMRFLRQVSQPDLGWVILYCGAALCIAGY